jgi:pyridoxal biosynthesis lyase PdxS
MTESNGNGNGSARVGTTIVKQGLAQMLKGGVIVSIFAPKTKISRFTIEETFTVCVKKSLHST